LFLGHALELRAGIFRTAWLHVQDLLRRRPAAGPALNHRTYAVEGFGEAGCSLGASPKASWRAGYPLGAPPNLPAMDDRVSRVNYTFARLIERISIRVPGVCTIRKSPPSWLLPSRASSSRKLTVCCVPSPASTIGASGWNGFSQLSYSTCKLPWVWAT